MKKFMSVSEIAEELNVNRQRIYRYIKNNDLDPVTTINNTQQYSDEDVCTMKKYFDKEKKIEADEDIEQKEHKDVKDHVPQETKEVLPKKKEPVNYKPKKNVSLKIPQKQQNRITHESIEIESLKRENRMLQAQLEQANEIIENLSKLVDQEQHLHLKTHERLEESKPSFQMPTLIEGESEEYEEESEFDENFEERKWFKFWQ